MSPRSVIIVRNTRPEDFAGISELSRKVYPFSTPWTEKNLLSHIQQFPEGQFVAIEEPGMRVVGMAASLIVLWDDYNPRDNYSEFTSEGRFTNHDPENGRTLYGAEVMVDPERQGRGVGKKMYAARRELAERLGLSRIRAGARLRGYAEYADRMSAREYVDRVVRGDIGDPTLSFQLKQGFKVLRVVPDYWKSDPESLGYAAIIEWVNPAVTSPKNHTPPATGSSV